MPTGAPISYIRHSQKRLMKLRRRRPIQTAVLNILVPQKIRNAVEDRADARGESLAEAARYFMELGIKHAEAV